MSQNEDLRRADALLEEAETLIWALLDEQLDDAGVERLSKLLEENAAARSRYIDCVQLHVDLHNHYASNAEPTKGTVVLQNLMPELPGLSGLPQVSE